MEFCADKYKESLTSFACIGENEDTCQCTHLEDGCEGEYDEPCSCVQKFDFNFVFDRSGSVELTRFGGKPGNWKKETDFFISFASKYKLGDSETRVSAVAFSTTASIQFGFDQVTQSQEDVEDKINAIIYTKGSTDISGALDDAKEVFTGTKRAGIPQVVVLATDGRHNRGRPLPPVVAEELRAAGIYIFVVGIGDESALDLPQLEQVAGKPPGDTASDMADWVFQVGPQSIILSCSIKRAS
jgi:hypothetical protein